MSKSKFQHLHLSPEGEEILYSIFRYVEQYQKSPDILDNAASDVMDGWKENSDKGVIELRKKKIIVTVREGSGDFRPNYTWMLTEYGKDLMKSALEEKRIRANTPKPLNVITQYAKLVLDAGHTGVSMAPSDLNFDNQFKELIQVAKILGLLKVVDPIEKALRDVN